MRLWLAIKAFFATLLRAETARQVQQVLLTGPAAETGAPEREMAGSRPHKPVAPRGTTRSDALTLLATLQREARFVDFVQEPLDQYSDAQVGAAARNVHRDCRAVLQRMLDIRPALDDEEGAAVEVPAEFDAGCYQLTGHVTGEPPFRGKLVHRGWRATHCDLPSWSGSSEAAHILAPAEVEMA
jgi:hypothetical protein